MNEKKYLNTLINNVVYTIDTLFKEKNPQQDLLDYLYLITTGMILNYGEDYVEEIYNTIKNIKYIRESSSPQEQILYYQNPANHNYLNRFIDFANLKFLNFKYELQLKKIDASNIKTLEYLTHEINYILFTKKRHFSLKDTLKVRFNFFTNHIIEERKEKEQAIDKVFNILQSEDIIKQILRLKSSSIKNPKFKRALKPFDRIQEELYKVEGLDVLVNLLRPLYNHKDIKTLINSLNSQDLLKKELDNVLGKDAYKEICKKLESLNYLISNSNNNNNYYLLSCEYVSIRNDYIKKYINLKYA